MTLPTLKKMMDDKIRRELVRKKKEKEKDATMTGEQGEVGAQPGGRQEKKEHEEEEHVTKEELDAISDKEFEEAKKTEKEKLHAIMDRKFDEAKEQLQHKGEKTELDDYWKTVSRIIENAWNEYLELDKEMVKKNKGRGEVKITTAAPKISTKKTEEDKIRNEFMYKAKECLKQARRCEQISHRITIKIGVEERKKEGEIRRAQQYRRQRNKEAP